MVEYINIRGIKGIDLTVPFWQPPGENFHTDSAGSPCQYNAKSGSVNSENNFGFLTVDSNPAFRASQNSGSTTEYWYGGHM